MSDEREEGYVEGSRMAWRRMLLECIRQLGVEDTEAGSAAYILEREDAVSTLRAICRDHGDNDWPDDLHLGDIIEKHLHDHLGHK